MAAKLINVTQPAVSRMIRDLQQQLGLTLFERRGHGTGADQRSALSLRRGRAGPSWAWNALRKWPTSCARDGPVPAHRRLAGAGQWFPAAVRRTLSGGAPQARPRPVRAGVARRRHGRRPGARADLGFAEGSIEHAAVRLERMPPAPYMAVLPQDHPLARKKRLRPADFEGESFISLGHSSVSRFRIDRVFADHGRAPRHAHRDPALGDRLLPRRLWRGRDAVRILSPRPNTRPGASSCGPSSRASISSSPPSMPRKAPPPPVAREFIDSFRAHITAFLRPLLRR